MSNSWVAYPCDLLYARVGLSSLSSTASIEINPFAPLLHRREDLNKATVLSLLATAPELTNFL